MRLRRGSRSAYQPSAQASTIAVETMATSMAQTEGENQVSSRHSHCKTRSVRDCAGGSGGGGDDGGGDDGGGDCGGVGGRRRRIILGAGWLTGVGRCGVEGAARSELSDKPLSKLVGPLRRLRWVMNSKRLKGEVGGS